MLIAIFYEFSKDEYSTGEAFSLFIACVTFIYLMIFTLFVIVHFFKYRKRHVTILDRFHVLYDGLRQSSWARFYYSFFLIRRLCLASVIFIDTDIVQLSCVVLVQIMACLYMILVRPFLADQDNVINMINETLVVICSCIFYALTDEADVNDNDAETLARVVIYVISIGGGIVCVVILIFAFKLIIKLYRDYRSKKLEKEEQIKNDGKSDLNEEDLFSDVDEVNDRSCMNLDFRIEMSNELNANVDSQMS